MFLPSTLRSTSTSSEPLFHDDVVIQPREILRRRYDADDYVGGYVHSPASSRSSTSTICGSRLDRLDRWTTTLNDARLLAPLTVVVASICDIFHVRA